MKEYPSAIATVDVIPFCYSRDTGSYEILLGRKEKHGGKLCFIGGFVDAEKDEDFLSAAKRELNEEVPSFGVKRRWYSYLFSCKVDDPRYKDRRSKIYTSFFSVQTKYAMPQVAGDDLDEVKWANLDELVGNPNILVDEHSKLIGEVAATLKMKHRDE